MIDLVIARLKATVPAFASRVEGAAELSALMRQNALPQVTPAAHVVPLGISGGRADAAAGEFRQEFDRVIGVLITLRTNSRTGDGQLVQLDTLIEAVTRTIAGWGPDEAIGVFRLARGQLVTMAAGTLVYQLDFAISDQLRILS